jgi:hypothetical protein
VYSSSGIDENAEKRWKYINGNTQKTVNTLRASLYAIKTEAIKHRFQAEISEIDRLDIELSKFESAYLKRSLSRIAVDYHWAKLEEYIKITKTDGFVYLSKGDYEARIKLTNVVIPADIETYIDNATFGNCYYLESVTLPDSVTRIGSGAFGNCHSLKSIVLPPKLKKIERSTFMYCHSLRNIVLPYNLESIDSFAFAYCSSLKSIAISKSVEYIHPDAFKGCDNLKNIYVEEGSEIDWSIFKIPVSFISTPEFEIVAGIRGAEETRSGQDFKRR